MAKQKPTVASSTKPKYPQAELKKIGQPYDYDAIGFKNSQIDMLKSRMNSDFAARQAEENDIINPEYAGFPMPSKSNRMASRYMGEGIDRMPDVSKRNYIIDKVYNAKGKLTGKTGVSKSALREHLPDLMRYRRDEKADYLKSSGDYIDSVESARNWAKMKEEAKRNVAKFDSTVKARGGKWDPPGGWPEYKKITRDINPSAVSKMKPLPTAKTIRGKKK